MSQSTTSSSTFVVGHLMAEEWVHNYPEVFSECLGKLKGFQHKIIFKEGAQAVAHKVRKVPLSLRSELLLELKKLCDMGIIEPIEGSE